MGDELAHLVDRTAPDGTVTLVVEGTEPPAWAFTLEAYAALKNAALTALSYLDADEAKAEAKSAAAEENAKAPPPVPVEPTPLDPAKPAPEPAVGSDGIPENLRAPPPAPRTPRELSSDWVTKQPVTVTVDKAKALMPPAAPAELPRVLQTPQGPVVANAQPSAPKIELPLEPGPYAPLPEQRAHSMAVKATLDLHQRTDLPVDERMARVHDSFAELERIREASRNGLTRLVDDMTAEVPMVADRVGTAVLDGSGPTAGTADVAAAAGAAAATQFIGGALTLPLQAVVHPVDTAKGLVGLPGEAIGHAKNASEAPAGSDEQWIEGAAAAEKALTTALLPLGGVAGARGLRASVESRVARRSAAEVATREAAARERARLENREFLDEWHFLGEGKVQTARPATAAELQAAERVAAKEAAAKEAAAKEAAAKEAAAQKAAENTGSSRVGELTGFESQPTHAPAAGTTDSPASLILRAIRLREAQLRLGRDPVSGRVNLEEGAGGAHIESALHETISRSIDPDVDFVSRSLGRVSQKGPLPRNGLGDVDGLIRSAINSLQRNTAADTTVVDLTGLSPAEAARVRSEVEAWVGKRHSKLLFVGEGNE